MNTKLSMLIVVAFCLTADFRQIGVAAEDAAGVPDQARTLIPQIHVQYAGVLPRRVASHVPFWVDALLHMPVRFTADNLGDDDLRVLRRMPTIHTVVLEESRLSAKGLRHLDGLIALGSLDLTLSKLDDKAIRPIM
jgi:hypothetical protein